MAAPNDHSPDLHRTPATLLLVRETNPNRHHTRLHGGPMSCTRVGNAVICHGGSQVELIRRNDGVRWCFSCRGRHEFEFILTGDAEPSYYEPNPSIRCTNCNADDGDCGFGSFRTWE